METNKKYTKTVNGDGQIAIFEKLEDYEQICVFSQDPEYVVGGEYVDDDSVDLGLEPSDYLLLQSKNNIIDNQNKFENIEEKTMTTKKTILIAALTSLAVNILLNWLGLVIFAAFLYFWIWCGRKAREIQKLNHEAILPSAINFIGGPISLFATIIVCEVCPWKVFFPFIPSFSLRSPLVIKKSNEVGK